MEEDGSLHDKRALRYYNTVGTIFNHLWGSGSGEFVINVLDLDRIRIQNYKLRFRIRFLLFLRLAEISEIK
jgi:hypothetical protein